MRESAERAEYIGEIAAGMARIARDGNLSLLAFILDMAALEARRYVEPPPTERTGGVSAPAGGAVSSLTAHR
jgi:hypothetical protein